MDLHVFWFVLLGILLTGYAILDGFDLGVGVLHLAVRKDEERRILLNSIGPLWDGNEVWLVTFGGALLAAFPCAYATVFSGFYTAFMIVLFALIFRAVSIEFRSKHEGFAWRTFWDVSFSVASIVAALIFGVAVGNAIQGIAIAPVIRTETGELQILWHLRTQGAAQVEYLGTFFDLLTPYPLLIGVFTVAGVAMHGAIYLHLKTEGELQRRIQDWMWTTFGIFMVLYMFSTIFTLAAVPHAIRNFEHARWAWVVVALNVLAVANIPRTIYLNQPLNTFLSSCAAIAALIFLFAIALFPNLVVSSIDPDFSLTIYNAASSEGTLEVMRIIAFLGMPFVLAYTAVIYWIFRGKVQLGKLSY
jgi:cytochrome d ubiquinol oxidase subunit II